MRCRRRAPDPDRRRRRGARRDPRRARRGRLEIATRRRPVGVKLLARVARLSRVQEIRRAIPFLAFPIVAFALAILISGCGSGAIATTSPSPSLQPPPPSPTPTPPTLVATITPTAEPTAKLDRIGRNRAKWSQAGIDTYRLTLQYGCFCEFGNGVPVNVRVVDGKVVEATVDGKPIPRRQRQGFPMTVDALFEERGGGEGGRGQVRVRVRQGPGLPDDDQRRPGPQR